MADQLLFLHHLYREDGVYKLKIACSLAAPDEYNESDGYGEQQNDSNHHSSYCV